MYDGNFHFVIFLIVPKAKFHCGFEFVFAQFFHSKNCLYVCVCFVFTLCFFLRFIGNNETKDESYVYGKQIEITIECGRIETISFLSIGGFILFSVFQ
jgi:hypothetical protein